MKNSRYCVSIILVMQLPMAFLHGVNLLAMNTPTPAIRKFINQSYIQRYQEIPKEATVTFIMTLVQSMLICGTLIGSLLVQPTLKVLSARKSALLVHAMNVLSVIFMGPVAKYASSYESLIVGRVLAGISRGIGYTIIMVIVAEFTSRSDMAVFQTPYQFCIAIASAFIAGVGHHQILGNLENWILIVCCPAVGSIIYFMSYLWIPESPVSLIRKGQHERAMRVLKTLRKDDVDIETELKIWEDEIKEASKLESIPIRQIIGNNRLRLQFYTVLIIGISAQFAGLQGISMYSNEIFLRAGVDRQYVTFATMATQLLALISFGLYVPMEKKMGTKKVFVVGSAVCCGSLLVFTIANGLSTGSTWLRYLALAAMLCNMLGLFLGPNLCKNSLAAELTTVASLPTAAFYSGCTYWAIGAITAFVFPYSIDKLKTFAYVPYVILMFLTVVFAAFYIPDTHKRNNAQIQNSFRKKSTQSFSEIVGFSRKKFRDDDNTAENYESMRLSAT